jgi:hypothetical protein
MKEQELREHAVCALCRQKIGWTGLPLFWTATIARHGVKMDVVARQDGLATFLGDRTRGRSAEPVLARIMGPDEDMTTELMRHTITLCELCATSNPIPMAALAEASE